MASLFDYYNTGDDTTPGAHLTRWMAMTFTTTSAYDITSVKLKLTKSSTYAPGTVTVSIRATTGGLPTGGDLASGNTDGDTLPPFGDEGEWREITFSAPYSLSDGTKYAIVIRPGNDTGGNDSVKWGADSSSPTYSGGSYCYSNNSGGSWTAFTGSDMMFETWGSGSVELAGSLASSSGLAGVLAGIWTIVGSLAGTSGLSGALANIWTITGSLASSSGLSGALQISTESLDEPTTPSPVYVPDFPPPRESGYDPDKVWDEETQAWYANTTAIGSARQAQAGGRLRQSIVAFNDQGELYFGGT